MEIEKTVSIEEAKGDCYRFLSACFYPPKKKLIAEEQLLENLISTLNQVCPEAVSFSEKMRKAFDDYTEEELSVAYANLFVGPFELKAPPYGSVYLDGERRLMGDSTMEVIRLYEEAGVKIDEDFKELPDHIAVELEFMYYLVHLEGEALEKTEKEKALTLRETREQFFNRFLNPWVFSFSQKIKEGTENRFYIGLADCLSAFISNESRN